MPQDGLPHVALVGRSNVGKSSLINALVRQRVARTSAAPGKTRLANVYRVRRGNAPALYLVDLPGYGFARGHAEEFQAIAADAAALADGALLIVDARHPGLENDRDAWRWLSTLDADRQTDVRRAIVANKIDKLSRAERLRARREFEAVFDHPVAAVSAETGEGLDELWILIDRLATHRQAQGRPDPRRGTNNSNR